MNHGVATSSLVSSTAVWVSCENSHWAKYAATLIWRAAAGADSSAPSCADTNLHTPTPSTDSLERPQSIHRTQ